MGLPVGFAPLTIENFRGLVTDAKPQDVSPEYSPGPCQNASFSGGAVHSRPGTRTAIALGGGTDILHSEKIFHNDIRYYLFLMDDFKLYYSIPTLGVNTITGGSARTLIVAPPGDPTHFQAAAYGNLVFLFFSNGEFGVTPPYVWDIDTGTVDIATILPETLGSMAAADGGPVTPPEDGITGGVHRFRIVFETRTGFRSKPTDDYLEYTAPGGLEVTLTSIPTYTGDADHAAAECTRRHIVMTEAGLQTYRIAYTIENNVDTSATFHLSDVQLALQTDVTNYFQYTSPLPNLSAGKIYKNRLVACGDSSKGTLAYISELDSPQSFRGDTGFLDIFHDDGLRLVNTFVVGESLYFVKTLGIYATQDNGLEPSEWALSVIAEDVGTVSISGVSQLSDGAFAAVLDFKGAYIFAGGAPRKITQQIERKSDYPQVPSWDSLNVDLSTAEIRIASASQEIYCLVPTGNQQRPNKIFKADYSLGWGNVRWSIDHTLGDQWRSLIVDGPWVIASINGPDVQIFDADESDDNGTAIDYKYRTGVIEPRGEGINLFGGLVVAARGAGCLELRVYDQGGHLIIAPGGFGLEEFAHKDLLRGLNIRKERVFVEFGHNAVGAWSEVSRLTVYAKADGYRVGGEEVCGTSTADECPDDLPVVTGFSPTMVEAGSGAFSLTVTGLNFRQDSIVYFNGSSRTTTYVSATELTASILAADVATIGTYDVYVENPTGCGQGNPSPFNVIEPCLAIRNCAPCSDSAFLFNEDFIGASICGGGIRVDGVYFWNFSSAGGNGTATIISDESGYLGIVRLTESNDASGTSETFLDIANDDCSFAYNLMSDPLKGYAPQVDDEIIIVARWHPGTGTATWPTTGNSKNNVRLGFSHSPDVDHSFVVCSAGSGHDTQNGAYFRSCDSTGNWEAVVADAAAGGAFTTNGEVTADTGVAVAVDQFQCFRIRVVDSSTLAFSVDDGSEVQITGFTSAVLTSYEAQLYALLGGTANGTARLDIDRMLIINRDWAVACPD